MNNSTIQIPEFKISLSMKQKPAEMYTVKCSKDVAEYAKSIFDADNIDWIESFFCIFLSRSNKVLGFFKISSGGLTATVADPRIIFQSALLANACSIIITHNHPSGNLTPSREDEVLTQRIKEAGRILEIRVMDHVIVSSDGYYSFADQGLL